jgi:hypothetical protein
MAKQMIIVTSTWGPRKTFKLIPISTDCPYNEAIYDPESKVLGVISKERKQSLHMVPKLNDMGDVQYLKMGKKSNGKEYAEERKTLETFYEYYIEENSEIKDFINMFATNAESYDYDTYLNEPKTMSAPKIDTSALVTV